MYGAEYILEAARRTPVIHEIDVLVCGGGVSGVGAAIGAARSGAKTLVLERNACLGGAATTVMMNTWNVPLSRMTGIAKEIAVTLAKRGAGNITGPTFPFDPEAFKELSFDLVQEAGAEVLNYSWVVDPLMDGRAVRGVIIQNKSGRQAIRARGIVDATGDADVAVAAGATCMKGREKDNRMRPMTVLFRLGGVDVRKTIEYCRSQPRENFTADPNFHILKPETGLVRMSGFFDIADRARAAGELPDEIHYLRFEAVDVGRGVVTVNNSRVYGVDGTNARDLSRADAEARRQNRRLFSVIRKYVPGFEDAFVIDSSSTVGVRETRRIRGRHVLCEEDLLAHRTYPDSVARIWRHMAAGRDWHKADGREGAPDDAVYRSATTELTWFEIPWGVFTPENVEWLTVAGRAVSATHAADMWTRGQYCCLVTGQIAGVASALAASSGVPPSHIDVPRLQKMLCGQGIDIGAARRD